MIRWIASYPKSGNTWVRLFLMAYQDPEGFDFNRRPENFRHDMSAHQFGAVSPVPVEDLSEDEVRLLRGAVLVRLMKKGAPCYMKTHTANINVNGTSLVPPEISEKAVYVLRDPRDLAISYADHLGESLDAVIDLMGNEQHGISKASNMTQPLLSWSKHVQSWLRPLPFDRFAVRYEDLLDEPRRTFSDLLHFLGIEVQPERLSCAIALTSFDTLQAREDEHGYFAKGSKQGRFFRCGKAGVWQDILTPVQLEKIEMAHREAMRMAEYH